MNRLIQQLLKKTGGVMPDPSKAFAILRNGVAPSPDLDRIMLLPRRTLDLTKTTDFTPIFKTPTGTMNLWPIQNAALIEMETCRGLFAPIGVGHGKTLISLLAPLALGSRKTVLLVPPQLKAQLISHDVPRLLEHFKIPTKIIHVVAYSELSSASKADILDEILPDLIVADECHNLRHRSSARTKRFLRYFTKHPSTNLVAMSGTITSRSIKDYAHLAGWALKNGSPLPHKYGVIEDWGAALDVSDFPMAPGELSKFCEEGEHVRSGFRRRLVSTLGVVSTEESSLGASLVITALKRPIPSIVESHLKVLRETWSIGGEEFEDAIQFSRAARQLACGFYYRWEWPGGHVDHEWLEARANWHREVRSFLAHRARPGCDSPLLVAQAANRGAWKPEHLQAWEKVKGRNKPPTVAVWLSPFLIQDAIKWAWDSPKSLRLEPGIIWYSHDAVGRAIAEEGNLPLFGAGSDERLLEASPEKTPVIVCSVVAHGTGKNLQAWSRNIFTCVLNGAQFEQILARTHRPGQLADEVTADVYLHTKELKQAWESALEDAEYIEKTQGQKQKLNYANKVGF